MVEEISFLRYCKLKKHHANIYSIFHSLQSMRVFGVLYVYILVYITSLIVSDT